eukprot:13287698-Alexandrium_andersonii.AAC.1
MVAGPDEVTITNFKMTFATYFLAKDTGKLCPGQIVRFIGRDLVHEGTRITVKLPKSYITKILEDFGLEKSKP